MTVRPGTAPRVLAPGDTGTQSRWWSMAEVAWTVVPAALALGLVLAAWQAVVLVFQPPAYLLPAPGSVWERFAREPGFFLGHTAFTVMEAVLGLVAGGGIAFLLGVAMASWRPLERALMPVAILVKVTPIVVIAPLLLIWFGFGLGPKVVVAGLITFFPVLVNTVTGMRSADPAMADVLRSVDAGAWRRFWHLRLPAAGPALFAALKVSIPLALIGAVVAEWVGAEQGIGQVMMKAHNQLDMPTLFAAIIGLALVGALLSGIASIAERGVLHWHPAGGNG